jgi:hypothetical protein
VSGAIRRGLSVAGLAFGLACAGAGTEARSQRPGALVAEAVSVSATVEAIDHGERRVLLRRSDGTLVALRLGPEVRNLDQVRRGDTVRATYLESMAIYVTEGAGEPAATAGSTVELAAEGQRPGAVVTNVAQITARVQSVDARTRTVTLMGPEGMIGPFRVDPSVDLSRVDPGDDVVARVTEAIAIEVTAP